MIFKRDIQNHRSSFTSPAARSMASRDQPPPTPPVYGAHLSQVRSPGCSKSQRCGCLSWLGKRFGGLGLSGSEEPTHRQTPAATPLRLPARLAQVLSSGRKAGIVVCMWGRVSSCSGIMAQGVLDVALRRPMMLLGAWGDADACGRALYVIAPRSTCYSRNLV